MRSVGAKSNLALVVVGIGLVLSMAGCVAPAAPAFPTKEVTYICAWAQGGVTDGVARALADATSPHLGKTVVVKNVVGGGGNLAAAELAKAKPDGYTIEQMFNSVVTISPYLEALPYKFPDDFELVSLVFTNPMLWVVRPDSPYKTMDDIIADAKKRPDQITYSYSGVTGIGRLGMERLFKMAGGVKLKVVPFTSTTEGVAQLLGGHVDSSVAHPPDVVTHLREGRLRALALLSASMPGRDRLPPGIKTLKEMGYDLDIAGTAANVLPKGVPKEASQKLHDAFKKGMESQSFIDYMNNVQIAITYKSASELMAMWKAEYEAFGPIVKDIGLKR